MQAALEEARAEQQQLRVALDEASSDGERAAQAHDEQLAATRAQLQALQESMSGAQTELRAERAKLEALAEEAALARQGFTDLEAALQQERILHEEAVHKVHPFTAHTISNVRASCRKCAIRTK